MFSSLLLGSTMNPLQIWFNYIYVTGRDVKLNLPKPTIFKSFFIEWYISICFLVFQYVNIVLNVHSLITKANHQTTTMSPTFFLVQVVRVKIRIFTDVSLSPKWKSLNLGIFSNFQLKVVKQTVECSNFSRKKRPNPSESTGMILQDVLGKLEGVAPNCSLSMNGV